jgi:hypothetical protein
MPLPTGTVVCLRCGFNRQLGRRMAPALVETAPQATASGRPAPGAARSSSGGGAGFLADNPWILGVAPLAIIALLYLVTKGNEDMAFLFIIPWLLFVGTTGIIVLVFAFMDGVLQGFLCLCVGPYGLYWVYGRNERAWLKWMYTAALVSYLFLFMVAKGMKTADAGE